MIGLNLRRVLLGILSLFLSFGAYGKAPQGKISNRAYELYSDIKYGLHPAQAFDVYARDNLLNAPVIFMVHGGAWSKGDKSAESVVRNKVSRWVSAGFVFVSVNYRLVPEVTPLEQLQDLQQAIVFTQKEIRRWGGSANDFILMGHSAGAHLVALLSSAETEVIRKGGKPWLGSILLDSAALNVPEIMSSKHYGFYDKAFGTDPAFWKKVSPHHQLKFDLNPLFLVCSSRRLNACGQAESYVNKAEALGVSASVFSSGYSHKAINTQLGIDGDYTNAVERFMSSLGAQVQHALMQADADIGEGDAVRVGPIRRIIQSVKEKRAD